MCLSRRRCGGDGEGGGAASPRHGVEGKCHAFRSALVLLPFAASFALYPMARRPRPPPTRRPRRTSAACSGTPRPISPFVGAVTVVHRSLLLITSAPINRRHSWSAVSIPFLCSCAARRRRSRATREVALEVRSKCLRSQPPRCLSSFFSPHASHFLFTPPSSSGMPSQPLAAPAAVPSPASRRHRRASTSTRAYRGRRPRKRRQPCRQSSS